LTLNDGENSLVPGIIDPTAGFAYFVGGASVVKIGISQSLPYR